MDTRQTFGGTEPFPRGGCAPCFLFSRVGLDIVDECAVDVRSTDIEHTRHASLAVTVAALMLNSLSKQYALIRLLCLCWVLDRFSGTV